MQLNISLDPSQPDEVNAAIAALHRFISMEQREVTFTPVSLPALNVSALDDKTAQMAPQPEAAEKAKRGRPRKEQPQAQVGENSASSDAGILADGQPSPALSPAVAAVSEGADAQASEQGQSVSASSAPSAPVTALTLDDVRSALQQYVAKKSVQDGIELLKKHGAQRISELDPAKYAEFKLECEA